MKQEIAVQLLWLLGVIFSAAGAGLMINWAIRGRGAAHTSMGTRFAAEAAALAVVFLPAYLGGPWVLALAVVLGCLCAAELYGTFEFGGDTPWKLSGILLGLSFLLYTYARPGEIGRIFPWFVVLYWLLRFAAGSSATSLLARAKRTCFGVIYPFLCLAFFVEIGLMEMGFGYVVLYYGLSEVNDSAAYLVGSSFGKRKIFPRLSPKKTVEGVVGGALFTLGIALAFWFTVPHFGTLRLMGAGAVIAAGGLAGDLFASRLKRRVGVKDYGDAVPTQGGVLDVYDAFIFVSPVFYYYLQLTGAGET
ncbi:MAG: phosphatidate cytidylyltransferase [Deltaproteobacteria bacterium]|nr:phosphatidate cytidylyltransferase [Deltaproteobacteria bacterium]